jgi:hypothetical protein
MKLKYLLPAQRRYNASRLAVSAHQKYFFKYSGDQPSTLETGWTEVTLHSVRLA